MSFHKSIFLAGALFLAAGCNTTTPTSATKVGASKSGQGVPKSAVPIDQQAFLVLASTNQLDPQWLQTPTNFFRLGPGDQIEIEVLGEGVSRTLTLVGPDGKIYYNLLPGLFVWGLTLTETKALIDDRLQQFFKDKPQVTITLRDVNSRRVWILGGVAQPGVYPLATPMTVIEVISLAGGTATGLGTVAGGSSALTGGSLTPTDVDLKNSFVMRGGTPLPVDLERLLKRGDLSQNIHVEPGDFIYLRPNTGRSVYVLGAVPRPGVIAFTENMSLANALVSSGGALRYGRIHEVAIIRGSLAQPSITTVDYKAIVTGKAPDVLLESGDIVYMPFVAYRKLAEFGESIIRNFVSSVALNEGVRAVIKNAPPIGVSVGSSGGISITPPSP